jgi:hypothetical protein
MFFFEREYSKGNSCCEALLLGTKEKLTLYKAPNGGANDYFQLTSILFISLCSLETSEGISCGLGAS